MSRPMLRSLLTAAALVALPTLAAAQWSPTNGQWGKSHAGDLRVMTFNVLDAICSTNVKNSATNNWAAAARLVAALQPDVLLLQECGDNSGNGTGSTVDTVANLTTAVGMFLRGGVDTFRSNAAITACVQTWAPGYDLPFVFVSTANDGFNRNVVLSRFPFADLNGDTRSQLSDIPTITADLWSTGGNGGIRGFMSAEIDLPDAAYAGNLVVGNCHLKAGTASSDHTQRITAAQNIAYFLQHFWNGAGGLVPDPRNRIADSPAATAVLDNNTPCVVGGDWNEEPVSPSGGLSPMQWIAQAQTADAANGTDGPDRNRTDMAIADARDLFTNSSATYPTGPYRDDYLGWQDSIANARRAFVFDSANVTPSAAMPTALNGFSPNAAAVSRTASDHRPVVVDLILPPALGCNTAGTDLGFARLGSNGRYPRASACGSLAPGASAVLTVADCPPGAFVFGGLSGARGMLVAYGGTIVPDLPILFGPLVADANGVCTLTAPGGGAPLYLQWAVLDSGLASGFGFSNALRLEFR